MINEKRLCFCDETKGIIIAQLFFFEKTDELKMVVMAGMGSIPLSRLNCLPQWYQYLLDLSVVITSCL